MMDEKKFKYRPPSKYLLAGIGTLPMTLTFAFLAYKAPEWFVVLVAVFFTLVFLGISIAFLSIFFKKRTSKMIVLEETFIEFQSRWTGNQKIYFHEIKSIIDFETYDHVIEIRTDKETFLIERNFMRNKEFYIVLEQLVKSVELGQIVLDEIDE